MTRHVLQLCPHDSMPFGELCGFYAEALACLDYEPHTVFLGSPTAEPLVGAEYLGIDDLGDTRRIVEGVDRYAEREWAMVICHRYRAYWAAARSRLDNRRCVAVAHEFGMLARRRRRLGRAWLARDVLFAGVSPAVAEELGAAAGEAALLPNGLNLSRFEQELMPRSAALQRLGLEAGPFTVGVVGRLHYKKRPELALAAFRRFCRSVPDARLVFVGAGELPGAVGEPGVHLPGPIAHARRLFAAFDVLLVTSTEDEAFGMVALEAMAAGVPVVCARIAGPLFVLGELGIYASSHTEAAFADALDRARACDRWALKTAGRDRIVKEFSVSAMARRLDDLLIKRAELFAGPDQ